VSRRRRAALLLGLALVLGTLAASDVGRREAAVRAQLGPAVPVVVARRPLAAGRRLGPGDLALRRVPARWVLPGAVAEAGALVGRRLAAAVPAGGAVSPYGLASATSPGAALRRGERAADVVAAGRPADVVPGARVDVLVTRDGGEPGGAAGGAELALQDVEVLAARPAPPGAHDDAGPRVAATLRVTLRQAVFLAAAGSFAREIRLLARAPGDRAVAGRTAVDESLRPTGPPAG
jgi:pilus assembly protein CpaB